MKILPAAVTANPFPEFLRLSLEFNSVNSFLLLTLSKFGVNGGPIDESPPDVDIERNIMSISSNNEGPKSKTLSFCIISSSEIS